MSIFWRIVVVILRFIGTLIYLIFRPSEYLEDSRELEPAVLERKTRSSVVLYPERPQRGREGLLICPACNWKLKVPCVNRNRPLHTES